MSKFQEILQYLYEWFAIVDDSLLSSSLYWNGIYDLNNIKLRLGLYKVSMTNLIQQLTKFMTGMVSMTLIIYNSDKDCKRYL